MAMSSVFPRINGRLLKRALLQAMCFVFLFGSAGSAHASVWGSVEANAWAVEVYSEVKSQLKASITGMFKQAVAQIMNTQISMLIGGGGGKGPMFIANWQTFLVSDPRNRTNAYMNDFFSTTTRGRNSLSSYRPATSSLVSGSDSGCEAGGYNGTTINGECVTNPGDASTKVGAFLTNDQRSWLVQEGVVPTARADSSLEGCESGGYQGTMIEGDCVINSSNASTKVGAVSDMSEGNYYKYQTDTAKQAINPSAPDVDLMNYVSGPSEVFEGGNWRGFNSFFSNPANNPFGYSMMAREAYQSKLSLEQHQADIQAVAYQGFKAAMGADGVTVKTPGITIGNIVDKAQGFSFDSISSAQDWGQIIAGLATTVITGAVQTGLNTATGALSEATGGMINLNLDASSLANTDWNGSGSGSASEFDTGMDSFNADATSGINGGNDTWGSMNFAGAGYQDGSGISSGTASSQDSYSQFGNVSFDSPSNTATYESVPSFTPDTDFSITASDVQSSGSFWAPSK